MKGCSTTRLWQRQTMAHEASIKEEDLRKGPWYEEEDEKLAAAVGLLGERRWDALAKASVIMCRSKEKWQELQVAMEELPSAKSKAWSNKCRRRADNTSTSSTMGWSKIARRLPGRTDNEIKNYWRCHLRKKALVLEQANTLNKAEQEPELLNSKCDTDMLTLTTSNGEDNIWGVSADSSDSPVELSNISSPYSPYEARLSDWISFWSYEQSEIKHHGDSCILDSCFCYPAWTSGKSDANIWSSSDSLWDMP